MSNCRKVPFIWSCVAWVCGKKLLCFPLEIFDSTNVIYYGECAYVAVLFSLSTPSSALSPSACWPVFYMNSPFSFLPLEVRSDTVPGRGSQCHADLAVESRGDEPGPGSAVRLHVRSVGPPAVHAVLAQRRGDEGPAASGPAPGPGQPQRRRALALLPEDGPRLQQDAAAHQRWRRGPERVGVWGVSGREGAERGRKRRKPCFLLFSLSFSVFPLHPCLVFRHGSGPLTVNSSLKDPHTQQTKTNRETVAKSCTMYHSVWLLLYKSVLFVTWKCVFNGFGCYLNPDLYFERITSPKCEEALIQRLILWDYCCLETKNTSCILHEKANLSVM